VRDALERAWRRWGDDWADPLAAVALASVALAILGSSGLLTSRHSVLASLCSLAAFALVGLRRRWPLAVALLAGLLLTLPELLRDASQVNQSAVGVPGFGAVFLIAYALGSRCSWGPSLVGLAALAVGVGLTTDGFNPLVEMLTIGPWLCGLVVASRRRAAAQLELRARELEEERELFAFQSVRYERARIARELHDIVAHCMSLMVVQASAGEHLTPSDPAGAAEAFASISEAARQAETEIDCLVELLGATPAATPSAGLRIVDELVGRVRASGLSVSCEFRGDSEDLSESGAEAAYRLVQEAVTNAMKHAPGSPIEIVVSGKEDVVEVRVGNGLARSAVLALQGAGGGHGLAGMRERVARCGGTFRAGPTADGGWQVSACLPRHGDRTAEPAQAVLPGAASAYGQPADA
jgi:signal transduction histidine kinase